MFDLESEAQWDGLLKDNHIVVVNFFKAGDNHCNRLIASLKTFASDLSSFLDTIFVRVEIKKYDKLAKNYGITEVPTMMVFHHGQSVKHVASFLAKDPAEKSKKTDKIVGIHPDLPKYMSDLIIELHKAAKK